MELAQYRELAAFAQFGSDLDKDTRDRLVQGERIMEVLKQTQYAPMPVAEQVLILYAVTRKYLMEFDTDQIKDYEQQFLAYVNSHYAEVKEEVLSKDGLTDALDKKLASICDEFQEEFKKTQE